jgi:[ribosomal protein S5]-alanine N-acetyltransferase
MTHLTASQGVDRCTARLRLRALREDDVPLLYAIQRDPVGMRYTYVAPSLQDCADRLWRYENSRLARGFAPWVVLHRQHGHVIGWGGLSVDPDEPEWGLEISYAFDPAHWGLGLATALLQHSITHAFAELQLPRLSAFAMADNVASIRVLQKCGFAFMRYESSLARNHYRLSSPAALA